MEVDDEITLRRRLVFRYAVPVATVLVLRVQCDDFHGPVRAPRGELQYSLRFQLFRRPWPENPLSLTFKPFNYIYRVFLIVAE